MRSAETGCTQQRLRKLPSPVVVSLLLAAGLFEHPGLSRHLAHAGCRPGRAGLAPRLAGRTASSPATRGRQAHPGPVRLAARAGVHRADHGDPLVRPAGMRDRRHHHGRPRLGGEPALGKHRGGHGGAGYPQLRRVALVACGTRAVIDAVFGPRTPGRERSCASAAALAAHRDDRAARPGVPPTPSWLPSRAPKRLSWSGSRPIAARRCWPATATALSDR
jgi:hypothetical protein